MPPRMHAVLLADRSTPSASNSERYSEKKRRLEGRWPFHRRPAAAFFNEAPVELAAKLSNRPGRVVRLDWTVGSPPFREPTTHQPL